MSPSAPVLVVGDSLSVGTAPFLPKLLHGRRVTQSATVSRSVSAGLALLRARRSSLPPVIVFALGTNDSPYPSRFGELVEEVLRVATPKRCVVWPTILRPGSAGGHSWSELNQVLTRDAATHPNLRLVQWVRLARAHPSWLGHDGVHVTVRGYRARAAAIATIVRTCDQPA
jgi:lysophospholipase L1-like esterase